MLGLQLGLDYGADVPMADRTRRLTPVSAASLATALALCAAAAGLLGCGGGSAAKSDAQHGSKSSTTSTTTGLSILHIGGTRTSDTPSERSSTVGEFGRRGTGAGELAEPFGIAVDNRNGDMYVVDSDNLRVVKFSSHGSFLRAWGWGVADGRTEALQTCTKRCFAGLRGTGAGQFEEKAEGVAVDNDPASPSYGDVYVVDLYNNRVQKFSPSGRFLLAFGAGVNESAQSRGEQQGEDRCPVKPKDVCARATQGASGAQLEFAVEGAFIVVGAHGTVYLGQRNSVKTFSPDGRFLSRIPITAPEIKPTGQGHEPGGISALAVDAAGDIYVVRNSVVGVNEYTPQGKLLRTLEPGGQPGYPEGPAPTLALDPAGRLFVDVYVRYLHRIDEYEPDGTRIASFDLGTKALPGIADKEDGLPGIAYNPKTRKLYVVNADINVKPLIARVRAVAVPQP